MPNLRRKLYLNLDPEEWTRAGLSPLNKFLVAIILFSIFTAILETEPEIQNQISSGFFVLNIIFAILFSIEYAIRIWVIGEAQNYSGIFGRLKYLLTWPSLIDLIATLAIWSDVFFQIEGSLAVILRLARVLRLLRHARKSKWAVAVQLLGKAISARKREMILSFGLAGIVLLISATILFLVEGLGQPEAFGSIPRSLWWAVATLTTIGYGDVFPITAIGKICASLVAFTSIAIIAMPTGIMAAAFSDAFSKITIEQKK